MILVTGAGGTVGSHVVKELQRKKVPFRAAFNSSKKAEAAKKNGIEACIIDYNKPDTLVDAFKNCDKLFLLGPTLPNQAELEARVVQLAKAAGIKHIVKLSVLGADKEEFLIAKIHRQTEKAIESSGMSWTFLRPNGFQQNTVTFMGEGISAENSIFSATGDKKISHVDVRDIAAVAVESLTDSKHQGKAYTLTGPEALNYSDVAAIISKNINRTIHHVLLEPDQLKEALLGNGIPDWYVDLLMDLERYYREDKAGFISGDVRTVTGKNPRAISDFIGEASISGAWKEIQKTL